MDGSRFDAWTRRRVSLAAGTLLAGLAGIVPLPGLAKKGKNKKKKCKKPKVKCKKKCCKAGQICSSGKCTTPPPPAEECQFTKTASLWTLQSNCTITKTIEIPDGVTLNGNNKTITMSGNVANYQKDVPDDWTVFAAVLANGGSANVRDLTIRGGALTGSCSETLIPEGLSFINTAGEIRNVTVEEIALTNNGPCGFGITATGTGGQTLSIEDVTVDGCPNAGVLGLTRADTPGITVNVDGAMVTNDGGPGISYWGGRVAGNIAHVSITGWGGISIVGQGDMTGTAVEISDVEITSSLGNGIETVWLPDGIGESGAFIVNVTRADITCTGDPVADFQAGIYYLLPQADFTSSVDDSVIRGGLFGIWQESASLVKVQNSTIENCLLGVDNWGGALDVHDNLFSGVSFGVNAFRSGSRETDAAVTNNTIQGGAATAESTFGVLFSDGATGTVSGNTISNFFDTDPSKPSCGIGVFENAGEVTVGANTFPDPPGNEEDICLDIPVPPGPLRAGRKGKATLGIEALRRMRDHKDPFKTNGHAGRDRKQSRRKDR